MMEKMICAIYVSEKKSDGWSEPVKLPEEVNSKKYSSTMPAVTTDPVRGNEVIYFVSDRRKGRGGLDIWYTVYDKKKRIYKPAKNAGSKVNTAQNEITPFFDNGTRSLYFSSDGLGGFGGYDIYKATGDGKKWTSVENLGQPLNTGADDIYYTLALDPSEGFFASNRKGGNALKNRTCCDDIYHFKNPEYIHVDLSGTVMDMIEGTLPIANAQVDVYIKDVVTGERYFVKSTKTDSLGRYETRLEPEQDYQLVIRKKDFLGNTEDISTKGIKANTKIQRHSKVVKRPKEPVPIPDFQYEFGRAEFTKESGAILDKMLIDVMKANPEIIVQVQSHTDSKGNELFNQKLSQKRADQIVNYVVSKGIEPSRIRGIGLGESQPVAPNDKPDGSDNPEGRAKNRRTEFKIIGTLDTEDPDGVSE
jgi:outer membrane protein OmpA-like peptidoglycan-associated protein